jgi:hypothetical protein
MARGGGYRVIDEPAPSRLSHLVVDPSFPLLAGMLGGFGFGVAWFILNAVGMGSATLRREAWVSALGVVLAAVGAGLVLALQASSPSGGATTIKLALLGLTLLKLAVLYVLQVTQAPSFALHQHFGGQVRNGILPTIALAVLGPSLLRELPVLVVVVLR